MTDLYELIDYDDGWRMPINVHWHNMALAEVTIAEIPLLKIQRQAIEAKLNENSINTMPHCTWYIHLRTVNSIAVKSTRTDPEQIVVWKSVEQETAVDADFVNAYCGSIYATVRSPDTFAVVWASIQRFMLDRLVNKGLPINLAFGRLDAFPVRANWKNAIIGTVFKSRTYAPHYTQKQFDFFRETMVKFAEQMTAYDADEYAMRWSLEFQPNEEFHAAGLKRERARQNETDAQNKKRWTNNYLGQIIKAIKEPATFQRLYENIVAYAQETNYPFALFPDGSSPSHPPKGYQPTHGTTAWYRVPLVTAAAILEQTGSTVVPADAGMPTVPDLRSPTQ